MYTTLPLLSVLLSSLTPLSLPTTTNALDRRSIGGTTSSVGVSLYLAPCASPHSRPILGADPLLYWPRWDLLVPPSSPSSGVTSPLFHRNPVPLRCTGILSSRAPPPSRCPWLHGRTNAVRARHRAPGRSNGWWWARTRCTVHRGAPSVTIVRTMLVHRSRRRRLWTPPTACRGWFLVPKVPAPSVPLWRGGASPL